MAAASKKIYKVFKYKFVRNSKFSKTLIAKHLSMLTEVIPIFSLYSSRGRFIILVITELFDI